jgi:hypothetical protein
MLLQKLGHEVTIWDKGRGASGRLSSKKITNDYSIQVGSKSLDSLPKWLERYTAEWIRLNLVKMNKNSLIPIEPLNEIIKHLNKKVEVNYGCKVINLDEKDDSVEITVNNEDSLTKYHYDRVIVALPIEQAIDVCASLGLEFFGESASTWVVWGPSDKNHNIPEHWESYYHSSDSGILEIRIKNNDIFDGGKFDSQTIIHFVTNKLGVDSTNWQSHYWKFANSVEGPGEIIHTKRVSIIGDGFARPLGTVGAAIESSGRVVSELHLKKLN